MTTWFSKSATKTLPLPSTATPAGKANPLPSVLMVKALAGGAAKPRQASNPIRRNRTPFPQRKARHNAINRGAFHHKDGILSRITRTYQTGRGSMPPACGSRLSQHRAHPDEGIATAPGATTALSDYTTECRVRGKLIWQATCRRMSLQGRFDPFSADVVNGRRGAARLLKRASRRKSDHSGDSGRSA